MCQYQSLNTSHSLSFPLGIHTFVLYVCVSISALNIGSSRMDREQVIQSEVSQKEKHQYSMVLLLLSCFSRVRLCATP